MNKTIVIFLVIIIGLLVYMSFRSDSNSDYIEQLENQNATITKQLSELQLQINNKLDSLKVIEKKETIIKNYYNEIFNQIDSINSDSVVNFMLRAKLRSLGPARLN